MGIAIAISAAATTKIRNTSTAPDRVAVCSENVTSARMTALSISSMHISMTSALRRTITPTRPSANSAKLSPSSSCVSAIRPPPALDDRDRRDDRRDQQHAGQLEMQPVLAQELDGERLHEVGRRRARAALDGRSTSSNRRDAQRPGKQG